VVASLECFVVHQIYTSTFNVFMEAFRLGVIVRMPRLSMETNEDHVR